LERVALLVLFCSVAVLVSLLLPAFQFTSPGAEIPFLRDIFPVRWYGLLIASAVLIGINLSQYLARRRQVNPELMSDLALWLVIASIPSARLYYVIFNWQRYAHSPGEIVAIWEGGIAIHGAILGGLVAALIFARLQKLSFWQLADLVAPSLILGQAIGRWGNFFNSEAFGAPTNLPWKLYIPRCVNPVGQLPTDCVPGEAYYHPTFLYESSWNLMVFGLLMVLFIRDRQGKAILKVGTLFLVYLVAYSCGRIWIEGLRTDSLMLGPLRMAQVVSLIQITIGLAGLVWLYTLNRSLPDVASSKKP
jgi:phosphatidylglycerol---prolipoprotein diacylglyceryl transferase